MTQPYNRNQGGHSSQQRRGDQSQDRSNNEAQQLTPSEDAKRAAEFIQSGNSDSFVGAAENMGVRLWQKNVKTNQLRNFYEAVVQLQMEMDDHNQVSSDNTRLTSETRSLHVKLAWAAAKAEGNDEREGLKKFYVDVKHLVEKGLFAETTELIPERYHRFKSFIETIVVYHRAKDKGIV